MKAADYILFCIMVFITSQISMKAMEKYKMEIQKLREQVSELQKLAGLPKP